MATQGKNKNLTADKVCKILTDME